jgi:uncharacterized protein (DUF3820 family)
MSKLIDESPMPIGKKYRGVQMVMIPDDYLIWYWKEHKHHLSKPGRYPNSVPVLNYIKESFNENELS